jgi:hypothetical protein
VGTEHGAHPTAADLAFQAIAFSQKIQAEIPPAQR